MFKGMGPPDKYCDNFFIFLTGHSGKGDKFFLYNPYDGSSYVTISYARIYRALKTYPEYVKVTMFVDICDCGLAVTLQKNVDLLEELSNHLCAMTVLTTVDDKHNSSKYKLLKHFMSGALWDYDQDGIIGDIKDRWLYMYDVRVSSGQDKCTSEYHNTQRDDVDCEGHGKPLVWETPGKSWCSLDGDNTPYTLPKSKPIADAGPDQCVRVGDEVQLDASKSRDPDGGSLTYVWEVVSAAGPCFPFPLDEAKTKFVCEQPGEYVLRLIVYDDEGEKSDWDYVKITCEAEGCSCTPSETEVMIGAAIGVLSDPAGHATYIDMPDTMELSVTISGSAYDAISISGFSPWVDIEGTYDPCTHDFLAKGRGSVAGFPDAAVEGLGTFDGATLDMTYTMGTEGGLPQSQAITYTVSWP
jgi:hypothetical protein